MLSQVCAPVVILLGFLDDTLGVPLPYTEEPVSLILKCTGDYSTLSYYDCSGKYYNSSGCYFLEHFNQYRPCARICNNLDIMSIDEEKCRAYCKDYADNYCNIRSSDKLLRSPSKFKSYIHTTSGDTYQSGNVKSADWMNQSWSIAVFASIPVLVLVVIVLGFLLGRCCISKKIRKKNCRTPFPVAVTATEETNFTSWEDSEKVQLVEDEENNRSLN